MGCNSSRSDKSCHEIALINGDNSLLYTQHDIWTLNASLKTFLKEGKIGKSDLKKFLRANSLASDEKVDQFYKALRKEKSTEGKILATLACLLCKGAIERKVEVLVGYWGSSGKMTKHEFGAMIDCMFELVIENLPFLASPPTTDNNYTPDEMTRFLERAKQGCEKSKSDISTSLFSADVITKSQLQGFYANQQNESWLIPFSIRQNLKSAGKSLRKSKKTAKSSNISNEKTQDVVIGNSISLSVELTEEHHHHHDHHQHHEGRIDASE